MGKRSHRSHEHEQAQKFRSLVEGHWLNHQLGPDVILINRASVGSPAAIFGSHRPMHLARKRVGGRVSEPLVHVGPFNIGRFAIRAEHGFLLFIA
jgi:hypothetical protein